MYHDPVLCLVGIDSVFRHGWQHFDHALPPTQLQACGCVHTARSCDWYDRSSRREWGMSVWEQVDPHEVEQEFAAVESAVGAAAA